MIESARKGNLARARRILTYTGVSKDPDSHEEIPAKHPLAQPLTMPVEDPPLSQDHLDDETHADLAKVVSRSTLAQTAQVATANRSSDQ